MFFHSFQTKYVYFIVLYFFEVLSLFFFCRGLPEINRKFSESGPILEKMYDRQFFLSQDNADSNKHVDDVTLIYKNLIKYCFSE